jgi:NAD(P)-dependent dehydrogenase (short-subunit alcohol dehydrogenase family)
MVGLAAYDASKGGVLMFTRNFAFWRWRRSAYR